MATVTKVGAQKWRVRWDEYTNDGKRHTRSKTFTTAAAAKQYRTQVETGDVTRIDAAISFTAYAEQWLKAHEPLLEVKSRKLYRRGIALASDFFKARQLQSIRPSDVELYAVTLSREGNGLTRRALAHKSIKDYMQILSIMFNGAVRDEIIKTNPCDRAQLPPAPKREKPTLDLDAIRAGVAALKGKPEYIPACLALYGGLRKGECMGLKWSDVDFDTNTLTVRTVRQEVTAGEQLNDHTRYLSEESRAQVEKDCPKNGASRSFQMPAPLIEVLKAHQHEQRLNRLRYGADYQTTEYVCTRETGKLLTEGSITQSLRGVCTFHQLRHAHITWLLDLGVPVTEVARRVGHSDIAITLRTYAHPIAVQDAQAAAAISAL